VCGVGCVGKWGWSLMCGGGKVELAALCGMGWGVQQEALCRLHGKLQVSPDGQRPSGLQHISRLLVKLHVIDPAHQKWEAATEVSSAGSGRAGAQAAGRADT